MTIRVPGEGDAPMTKKGSKGDLLVRVNVGSSDVFRRQGTQLYHDARIPFQTAVLGGKVRVPTLDSDVEVRVQPGTQHGEDVVLRGRGIDSISRKGTKGDLFISFLIEIPRSADLFFLLPFAPSPPFWSHYALPTPFSSTWLSNADDCAADRSLSRSQRELMQRYADEVEGRSNSSSTDKPPTSPSGGSGGGASTSTGTSGGEERRDSGTTGKAKEQHGTL